MPGELLKREVTKAIPTAASSERPPGGHEVRKIISTRLRSDTQAKGKWMTEEGGGYMAAGAGGAITGKGFKIGIVDDIFKNKGIDDKAWQDAEVKDISA